MGFVSVDIVRVLFVLGVPLVLVQAPTLPTPDSSAA